jgi:two-component system, NarL family, sensor histidine kinase NreB
MRTTSFSGLRVSVASIADSAPILAGVTARRLFGRAATALFARRVAARGAAGVETLAPQTPQSTAGALEDANRALHKLSSAIEQSADSVLITDRNGTIEYVNPAFEAMTGFSRAEAIGANPRLVSSGLQDNKFYETMWQTILGGSAFRAIVTNKRKDGRLFTEDQTIAPIRDAGGTITHFVSTGRDITERKRAEAALRRLNTALEQEAARIASVLHDEAGQFLSSAHITLADVARDLAPEHRARVQQVRHHLDLAEQQLRRVSHELHPRMLDDLGLIEAVRFLVHGFGRRTGISVDVDVSVASSCPRPVETIVYRLVQEGLTNIGKHARATRVSVVLGTEEQRIVCAIRDDGVGFDVASTLEKRDRFSLGLTLMRDRVEAVGGTLTIVSTPARGSELRASVPMEV